MTKIPVSKNSKEIKYVILQERNLKNKLVPLMYVVELYDG